MGKLRHVKTVYLKRGMDTNEALSCSAVRIKYNVGQWRPAAKWKTEQCKNIERAWCWSCDGVSSDKTRFPQYCCLPLWGTIPNPTTRIPNSSSVTKNVTKKRCVSAWPKISATKEFPFFKINSNQKSRVKYHLGNEGAEQEVGYQTGCVAKK